MIDSDDARLLVELGFTAISLRRPTEAKAIFDAIRVLRPQEDAGFIGQSLVMMLRGETETAVQLLRKAAPSDAVQLFLGLTLLHHGDLTEATLALEGVADTSQEAAFVEMARALIASIVGRETLPLPR